MQQRQGMREPPSSKGSPSIARSTAAAATTVIRRICSLTAVRCSIAGAASVAMLIASASSLAVVRLE
jgi:hypothetical protein